jgi:hypothetical protein
MHIKQGSVETPLKIELAAINQLCALIVHAGTVARRKAALAADEARIKEEFEPLRRLLETKHGLSDTYALVEHRGQIQVTLGEEYILKDKFTDPEALRKRLRDLGAPDLLDLFEIKAKPDQRLVKEAMCADLKKIGELRPKTPAVSLRSV